MNQNILQAAIKQVMPTAVATGLFVSLCSISAPAPQAGAISGAYSPVTGLQQLGCMDAPETFGGGISATEVKVLAETASLALRHILLNGYYSQLSPATNWGAIGWRATITEPSGTSVEYDILGAECDSQQTQTRLKLRMVTT